MVIEIAVGLVIGILTGMGIGSSGLLVLYLTEIRGLGQLEAQGVNLLFFVAASVAALCIHREKRELPLRLIRRAVICASLGSFAGAYISGVVAQETVRRLFGWMLTVTGGISCGRQAVTYLRRRGGGRGRENL